MGRRVMTIERHRTDLRKQNIAVLIMWILPLIRSMRTNERTNEKERKDRCRFHLMMQDVQKGREEKKLRTYALYDSKFIR